MYFTGLERYSIDAQNFGKPIWQHHFGRLSRNLPGNLVWINFYFPALYRPKDKTSSRAILQVKEGVRQDKDLLIVEGLTSALVWA